MFEVIMLSVPLTLFDQQKLEFLVRKIPESLVKVEEKSGLKKNIMSFLEIQLRILKSDAKRIIT